MTTNKTPPSTACPSTGLEAWTVCSVLTAITLLWALYAGKNVSWDVINHHLYLPFSLVTGRFQTDLFAAGPQSYQNPLGYLPFYALLNMGVPDWLVGTLLALTHAAAAGAVYGLASQIWGPAPDARFWRITAAAAAWIAPIFLILVGTSSPDALTNVMVLWALWAALRPRNKAAWRAALLSGALLGLAFAVKPSNAVFVLSVGAVVALRAALGQASRWHLMAFGSAAGTSALLAMGMWSAWLWSTFGNPLFPLFNQLFASPYAPAAPIVATRFLPTGASDYILRLWDLVRFQRYISTEAFAPDLRPMVLAGLLACTAALLTWRQRWWWAQRAVWARVDVQLAVFVVLSYVLWLKTSGNARYAVPLFMVCGLLLVRACQAALPRRVARVVVGLVLALQILYYVGEGEHRFVPAPWTGGPYLDARVPQRLQNEPFLHLSIGVLTSASVAPYLNHGGALVNVIGQMSLPVSGALGVALQERLSNWQGRTRFLFRSQSEVAPAPQSLARQTMDATVYRLGLQVDWSDCEAVWFESDPTRLSGPTGGITMNEIEMPLLSCRAMPRVTSDATYEQQHATADRVFAAVEALCPRLFAPIPFVSEYRASGSWQRFYMNADASATVSLERGVFISPSRSTKRQALGSVDDVLAGRAYLPCDLLSIPNPQ